MRIGQISFFRMSSPVERPYGSKGLGSKYQGQSEPTASAFHEDFAAGRKTGEAGSAATGAGSPSPSADGRPSEPARRL